MELSDDDKKLYLDWNDIESAISNLANDGTFDSNTIIIGLTRGGLVPAVMLSHATGCSMKALAYSSKAGMGDHNEPNEQFPVELFDRYNRICIVDEICDSGHTLRDLINHIEQLYQYNTTLGPMPTIETMVVVYKEMPESVYKPDHSVITIQEDCKHVWTVFPWEHNNFTVTED